MCIKISFLVTNVRKKICFLAWTWRQSIFNSWILKNRKEQRWSFCASFPCIVISSIVNTKIWTAGLNWCLVVILSVVVVQFPFSNTVSFCLGRFSDISLKASIEYAKYFCTWLSWQWLYVQLNEHCFLNFYPKKCLSQSKVICLEPKRELIPFLAARPDLDTFLVVG